jgi:hypothetical protein
MTVLSVVIHRKHYQTTRVLRNKDSLKDYQIWGGPMLAHSESNVKLEQLYFIKERL